MAKCSSRQLVFVFFNFLFLCLGLTLVGFVAWTLATIPNANEFISGTHIVTLTSFCLGFVILVIGGIGCAAGFCKGLCILKTYVSFMVTLLFLELGLVFFIYSEQTQIPSVMIDSWSGLNVATQYKIQTELECCGIENYTEYGTDVELYPSSCFVVYDVTGIIEKTVDTLFTTNCLTQMQNWLNNHIPIWASVILGIAVIQCLGGLTSCVFLQRVQKKLKVKPNDDEEGEIVDSEMASMGAGSSKDKASTDTENEEQDNIINSSGLLIVTQASEQDIKDNSTIDYLNENNDDTLSTNTHNEVKDEANVDTISNHGKDGSSVLVVASVSKKVAHDTEIKDSGPDDEVETIILTQSDANDVTNDTKDKNDDNVSNRSVPVQSLVLIQSINREETGAKMQTTTLPVQADVGIVTPDQTKPISDMNDDRNEKKDDNIPNHNASESNEEKAAEKELGDTNETDDIEIVYLASGTTDNEKGNDKGNVNDDKVLNFSTSDQLRRETSAEEGPKDTSKTDETVIIIPVTAINEDKDNDERKECDSDNISIHSSSDQLSRKISSDKELSASNETDQVETVLRTSVLTSDEKEEDKIIEDDNIIPNHSSSDQSRSEMCVEEAIGDTFETDDVKYISLTPVTTNDEDKGKDDGDNNETDEVKTEPLAPVTTNDELKNDKGKDDGDINETDDVKTEPLAPVTANDELETDKRKEDDDSNETDDAETVPLTSVTTYDEKDNNEVQKVDNNNQSTL
ncbi:CAR1 transcription factor-like [Pecten maximus]|uniref:CAR1 transcription factor-like n=1 Tax=Pecten maximus TaxID=6579 RepID=UPI001458E50A|nr:CAR1 transcription factor-like [Pecten maximus]